MRIIASSVSMGGPEFWETTISAISKTQGCHHERRLSQVQEEGSNDIVMIETTAHSCRWFVGSGCISTNSNKNSTNIHSNLNPEP